MKKNKILIAVFMVLLFISACAPKDETPEPDNGTPDVNEPDTPDVDEPDTPDETPSDDESSNYYHKDFVVKLTAGDVFDTFLADHEGVQVKKIELSLKRGGYVYEIEGFDQNQEYEAEYDANTGDLIELETDNLDQDNSEILKNDLEEIKPFLDKSFDDAGEGYYLDEWTLKHKDGVKIIEVEVENEEKHEIEYKYNVETGELLEKDQ